MSDLISRQAAIGAMAELQGRASTKAELKGISKAWKRIKQLPSAKPDCVVECKDCVNWIPGKITEHDNFIPPKCGKYQQMVGHSSDDYCSFAVRRTDEEAD